MEKTIQQIRKEKTELERIIYAFIYSKLSEFQKENDVCIAAVEMDYSQICTTTFSEFTRPILTINDVTIKINV